MKTRKSPRPRKARCLCAYCADMAGLEPGAYTEVPSKEEQDPDEEIQCEKCATAQMRALGVI